MKTVFARGLPSKMETRRLIRVRDLITVPYRVNSENAQHVYDDFFEELYGMSRRDLYSNFDNNPRRTNNVQFFFKLPYMHKLKNV